MTDKEKLDAVRAEINRLVEVRGHSKEMANDLLTFMDSLPNEPVSEDLEEFIEDRVSKVPVTLRSGFHQLCRQLVKDGANWQKKKDEKELIFPKMRENKPNDISEFINRLTNVEQEFLWEHIGKVRQLEHEETMSKAVDGVVHHFSDDEIVGVHYNTPDDVPMTYFVSSEGLSAGDKVKILVIKQE